jgi:hypothetical protein
MTHLRKHVSVAVFMIKEMIDSPTILARRLIKLCMREEGRLFTGNEASR